MKKSFENCWPSAEQQLLLQAGLQDEALARLAWKKFNSVTDIKNIDYVSSTLLPMVFNNFRKFSSSVSQSNEMQTCKSLYRYTWSSNHLLFLKLKQVISLLQDADIDVCLLKGAAMVACYYHDPGLRVMGDIDIFIPLFQVKKAIELLIKNGWHLHEINLDKLDDLFKTRHAVLLIHADGGKLDVHWNILLGGTVDKHLSQYVFGTHEIRFLQYPVLVKVMLPEDQLIHVIFHGLKYSPQPLVRWIADAVAIIKTSSHFDWGYFLAQANKIKIEFLVKKAIGYLYENAFVSAPEKIVQKLKQYIPTKKEMACYHFFMHPTHSRTYPLRLFWYWHTSHSESENLLVLILTIPLFIKRQWNLKYWHQVPWFVTKKIGRMLVK